MTGMFLTEAFAPSTSPFFCKDYLLPSLAASHSDQTYTFDDLIIIERLNKAKFPVFLSYSPSTEQYFAIKVFPCEGGKINPLYINEITFASLRHANIISIHHYESERQATFDSSLKKVSYTIMDYAPYGDFFDVIMTKKINFDETLARTYFHQLIDGLEYIHMNGMAHMDIKLENLLLGDEFKLKIADFDHAHLKTQKKVQSKGTVCYRAPELIKRECEDSEAADVYSAGIILFVLKTGGILPHCEEKVLEGINLLDLLYNDNKMFWEKHCKIQGKKRDFFDQDFKELFNSMVDFDPKKRVKLADVKNSSWYRKAIYSEKEVISILQDRFSEE